MSQVTNAFPGMTMAQIMRRTIRAPTNPMDKSTVISIYPRIIDERKHTIQPGRFYIPAGSVKKPSLLVVGSSSWWKDVDENQPLLEIPNSSIQVADSIVKDYCNGLLGCNMADSMPGIFWVPGKYEEFETFLKGEFGPEDGPKVKGVKLFETAVAKQTNYWKNLVKMADNLWARTNGNPLCISDDMRTAATELNLTNKDWMKDFAMVANTRCTACGQPRNPDYPVCHHCHAIVDPDKAKSLGIVFAQK